MCKRKFSGCVLILGLCRIYGDARSQSLSAKLAVGLLSGKYSSVAENSLDTESTGISPAMFKNLIGKNHPDFSTKQQQDAQEFFLHLVNVIEKNSRNLPNPADALKFRVEDRVECGTSGKGNHWAFWFRIR